jgi:hypothetical protein
LFEKFIARGMALLDAEAEGWVEAIDLDRLDMGSAYFRTDPVYYMNSRTPCGCILAQLDVTQHETPQTEGSYYSLLDMLWPNKEEFERYWELPGDYGFALPNRWFSDTPIDEEYYAALKAAHDQLTREWKAAIRARRATVEAS